MRYFFTLEIAFKPGKQANIYFFFALKKSEQAEIVTFNRLAVNYNIDFLLYRRRDQTTAVDSCDTGQINMEWKPGGTPQNSSVVGACRPVLQILTLFQTKTCHFPYPFSDLTFKNHTRFQT